MRALIATLLIVAAGSDRAIIGGRVDPSSHVELAIDLPGSQHLHNKTGRDGSGLCVFASMDMAARWQHVQPLIGILEKMRSHAGGGWPDKVDSVIQEYYPGYHDYAQAEGRNSGITLMEWAIRTNRMACVTYGYSERYGGRVSHMVCLVHLDANRACILDNNFPGVDKYEWMDRDEFLRRWNMDGGWAYVFFAPPPPPALTNGGSK